MRLPPDQREVIRLAFLASMTHEQIAASLHMPLGTVKTRIRLGLHRMKTYLPESDEC
jgi:RNA polymerase sigma-70 factor (ECF subfamily)